jgi:predicted GNAT family acetyltransferase
MAKRHVDNETLWVWAHPDPTCMALSTDATSSTSRISWVYTPKPKRARGYGSALVASLTARGLARGKRACSLDADVRNATSNAIYVRIGYSPIGSAKTVIFDRALDRT